MLNHNIYTAIIKKCDHETHNKLCLVNKYFLSSVTHYYRYIFDSVVAPNVLFSQYVQLYHKCDFCQNFEAYLDNIEGKQVCNKCSYHVDMCDLCGSTGLSNQFVESSCGIISCRDKCEYICFNCDGFFTDKKKITEFYGNTFVCLECLRNKGFIRIDEEMVL